MEIVTKDWKVIKKWKKTSRVGVAVSHWFGAWWTTWNKEVSPFEPKVIHLILDWEQYKIDSKWCKKELWLKDIYCGWVEDLSVERVEEWEKFSINEYDGAESLYVASELEYTA